MSGRWTRALLRAYPRRIRRRYGAELLDLQDQLRAEGSLSRRRLIGDVLRGARLARSGRRRASGAVVAVLLAAAMSLAIVAVGGRHGRSPIVPSGTRSSSVAQPDPYGDPSPYFAPSSDNTCFGDSRMTCEDGSCQPTPRGCRPPPSVPSAAAVRRERAHDARARTLQL